MSVQSTLSNSNKRNSFLTPPIIYPLFLLILPIIVTFFNSRWLFIDLHNSIDPWIYLGYSMDLKSHLNIFDGTYYGTRLPWILPGFLAYHFFSPLTAKFIFQFAFYFAAVFSLFRILKKTVGIKAAFLTTLIMELWAAVLLEFGSHYISAGGLTYLLLSLSMITYTSRKKYALIYLFLAGVFFSCFIFVQLFLVVFIPCILLFYVFFNRPHTLDSCLNHLGVFSLGFFVATGFFCLINYFLTGKLFFYEPIFQWTSIFLQSDNAWWFPLSLWDWQSLPSIGLFAVILLGTCISLISRDVRNHKSILFFSFYFITQALLFIFIDFVMKQPVLQLHYYLCYIFPALFLAVGGIIALALKHISCRNYYTLVACAIIGGIYGYFRAFPHLDTYAFANIIAIIVIGGTGMIFLHKKKEIFSLMGIVTLITAFSLSNIAFSPMKNADHNTLKNIYNSIVKTVKIKKNLDPSGEALFWYCLDQPILPHLAYKPISSSYLWGYRLVNENFPKIAPKSNAFPLNLNGKNLFILSTPEELPIEAANKSLADLGLKGILLKESLVKVKEVKIKVSYIHVTKNNS